jgi:hypothetical protein
MGVSFTRFVRRILAPVVEDVYTSTIVTRGSVARFHCDAQHFGAEARGAEITERFAAGDVDADPDFASAAAARQRINCAEHSRHLGSSIRLESGELNVADAASTFGAGTDMANGKTNQLRSFPDKHKIAKSLFRNSTNFAYHIQAFEACVRHIATSAVKSFAIVGGHLGQKRDFPLRCPRRFTDLLAHRRNEIARPEPEFLVQRNMFRACRKRVKSEMSIAPALEQLHGRREQLLSHSSVPVVGMDREGSEETEAAPVRREIRSDQFAVMLGRQDGGGIGSPSRAGEIRVTHERFGSGDSEKCCEREAHDAVSCGQVALDERPDDYMHGWFWRGDMIRSWQIRRLILPRSRGRGCRTDKCEKLIFGENAPGFLRGIKNTVDEFVGGRQAALFEPVNHI